VKILILSGSRDPKGQTAAAIDALAEGVRGAGGETETVFLPTKSIERCRQCENDGWGLCRAEGRCVIEDDLSNLVDMIRTADRVVFATPVYFSDLAESLRAFLDRFRRICVHGAKRDRIADKPAIGICVAGGGGGGAAHCTTILESILQVCGLDVVDVIPVRRQNLEMKLEVLRTTGRRFATD